MTLELWVVGIYMLACIAIGILASRKVLVSRDDYWVAGRRIGTWVNAMAIMATLASGGSIIGVMGLAYKNGIPYALALFAGAVLGFPLASILVAKPLRNFGKFTITDFLVFRYPHAIVRYLVPIVIVVSFTVYIIAQMKAAGITANVLLGISYNEAVTWMTIVFILYVSIGGMLAVTWTDVVQGVLMLAVVLVTAAMMINRAGSPAEIMEQATLAAPMLGEVAHQPVASYLGSFVIWAAAIPVIPHIVMRVFTAKDAAGARLSLNLAMVAYSVMILAAVLAIVPVGKMHFPDLQDADTIFLEVMKQEFPPLIRGLAVAAVMAAVMSTTDALLLACSSALAHDLFG
ncbi:sodium:solute symporter family protein, partial [candidate division KSB1 bacterium]|nr:sodium:solute symporter family protein [candidate division KSB1 bacterium]